MEISQEQANNVPMDEHAKKLGDVDHMQTQEELHATQIDSTTNVKKRKKIQTRSIRWDPYDQVTVTEGVPPVEVLKGKCRKCGTLIAAENGTTALQNHTTICSRRQAQLADQTLLNLQSSESVGGLGSLTSWRFDQKASRMRLCEMILLDELPFKFIEHEGFKKFVSSICPQFNIPTRKTIKEDCIRLFIDRKEILKSLFSNKGTGRVSITTDCWTAINNTSYVCVTGHFIGKNWKLHKKIISFRKISGHRGDDIADSVLESLSEWNLKTILCCTVDNASANDKAVQYIRSFLDTREANILGGKYLHFRCVAHIINLIVSDGLEEIGMSVKRVREAVKWIKASPMRSDQFQNCVKLLQIDCKRFFSLDVPTRWNSTYLMLEAAEPYEAAIKLFGSMNSTFMSDLMQRRHNDLPIGPPEEEDWNNVRKMIEYLKKFYELTRLVSGTSYTTSHLIFKEICDLFDLISELEQSTDVEVILMANKMKSKVGKYWLEADILNPKMNKIMYIAAVMDLRQKMRHVEKCLKKVYGSVRASELAREVRDSLVEIFDFYKKMGTTPSQSSTQCQSQDDSSSITQSLNEGRSDRRGSCSLLLNSSDDEDDDSDSSELTLYLAEKYNKETTFDILVWWSKHGIRFPILSEIAKDILAILVSTVASESAFSTGGRVLDAFRSSLSPSTVEALICTEDWLRSSSTKKTDEEDQIEEEQEEEFVNLLSSIGVRGNEITT